MNADYVVDEYTKAGQIKLAVGFVLSEIRPEFRDELLERIAILSISMDNYFFKGSRRAISHMSEPLKTTILSRVLKRHKVGFGHKHDLIFPKAWIETIKMLPEEKQEEEFLYFFREITQRWMCSDILVKRVREAISLLSDQTKKHLLFTHLKRINLVLIFCHHNNNEALFYLKILEGVVRDRVVSFVLKVILRFNQSKSFRHIDDGSIFTDVLSLGKTSNYVDKQMFSIVKAKFNKLILGSNAYSGKEMVRRLSAFMSDTEANKIIDDFDLFLYFQKKN